MRDIDYDETAEMLSYRCCTLQFLQIACAAFIWAPRINAELGPEVVSKLQGLLTEKDGWRCFSGVVRDRLIELQTSRPVSSTHYWKIIDAIGFYCDSVVGAWPYMDHAGRFRALGWSREDAALLIEDLRAYDEETA